MAAKDYDFIIAGGGTAGLVLAARLSEDASQHVLVLEAGADLAGDQRVELGAQWWTGQRSDIDWAFTTEPQNGLKGRRLTLNQGKGLGGSSALNAQNFSPPTQKIINAWAALGNDGWDWETLRHYYNKTYTPPFIDESQKRELGREGWPDDDGKGPLQLSFPEIQNPVRKAWIETFRKMGNLMPHNPWVKDSVGGFSNYMAVDQAKGTRSYAASAYYNLVRGRDNVDVLTGAVVEKVLFARGSAEATGVQYQHGSQAKTATARKEVILAAGASQSPKLLELSGVGRRDILERYDIPVIVDLPHVGENLQDHLICEIGFEALDSTPTKDGIMRQESEVLQKGTEEFTTSQTGPLTSSGLVTYAYMPTVSLSSPGGSKELAGLLERHRPTPEGLSVEELARARAYYEIAEKALIDPEQPSAGYTTLPHHIPTISDPMTGEITFDLLPGNHISFLATLSHPLSRGNVHIRSADASDQPAIDFKYLSHPADLEILAEHVLHLHTLAASAPLSDLLKQPITPSRSLSNFSDLEGARDYVRLRATTMWHPAGTCAMLPRDKGGVLDPSLRVYGAAKLRVVDASAVPLLPVANLQSTIYAMAERAADLIKEEHGLKLE